MKNFTGRAEIEFPKIRLKLKSICYKLHGELFQVYQGRLFVCPSALLITCFKLRYRLFFFSVKTTPTPLSGMISQGEIHLTVIPCIILFTALLPTSLYAINKLILERHVQFVARKKKGYRLVDKT